MKKMMNNYYYITIYYKIENQLNNKSMYKNVMITLLLYIGNFLNFIKI